ncbi:MAG: sodium-dependent bicarbonate transport family permease [bacterium]
MFILIVLVGSFALGVLLQLTINHFYNSKSNTPQLINNWNFIRNKLHIFVVAYLLIHIGLVGGAEVAHEGLASLAVPGMISIGLAMTLFVVTMLALMCLQITDRETSISLAAHFGSVSVGTFAAAQAFLNSRGIPFASSTAAWLALMEVPSILAGAVMLGGGFKSIKDTLGDRDILLLLGTLVMGYVLGPRLVHRLDFLIVAPFEAVLAYFLFDMGQHAGGHITQLRDGGVKLIGFGILMALFGGILGGLAGTLFGMSIGNVAILSTLSASASYVAATAVMSKLVSARAIATTLTVSLGITLPWNILLGIQLYTFVARELSNMHLSPHVLGSMLAGWLSIVCGILLLWSRWNLAKKETYWEEAGQEGL